MKRKIRLAVVVLMLASVAAFGGAYWLLGTLMPEQLVAAQIYRPPTADNPLTLRLPLWFVDLHWRLTGERMVDRENRSGPSVVDFMLGTELRRSKSSYPLDQGRFHELMKHYVCEAPSGIRSPAELARIGKLNAVPEYLGALEACGRIRK